MRVRIPADLTESDALPVERGKVLAFNDVEPLESTPHLLMGFNLKRPKEENMLRVENYKLPEVEPVPDYFVSWDQVTMDDFRKKSKKLDEKLEQLAPLQTNVEEAVKRLKCAPVLKHYMQGLSAIWKKVNGISRSKRAQDDINLIDRSNIVATRIKVNEDKVTEFRKAQKKHFKKARKIARNEMKDSGFHFEFTNPKKSKQQSDQTVPQCPSLRTVFHENSYGEEVAPPVIVPVPVLSSPLKDPRRRKKKVAAPEKPIDDPFDIFKYLPLDSKKKAIIIVEKEIPTTSTAPTIPTLECLVNPNVLAKVQELLKVNKVGPLPGGVMIKRTAEEMEKDDPKRSKNSSTATTASSSNLQDLIRSTFASLAHPFDDLMLVDEVGDDSDEARPTTPPINVIPTWRLANLTFLSDAKGIHRLRGLPHATEAYINNRINSPACDYTDTPKILLDREVKEPPRKRRRKQDIFELLGIKTGKAKRKQYVEQPRLSIFEQLSDNSRQVFTAPEIEGLARGIIRKYGDISVSNFRMPTKYPYDGLYWPIFQPIDAIDIRDPTRMENADVQNQIVNQSVKNYIAKRLLMCDDSPCSWDRGYREGFTEKKNRSGPAIGRFTHRVGYARCLNGDNSVRAILAARENHKRQFQMEKSEIEKQKARQEQEVLRSRNQQAGDASFLKEYKNACKSTRLNDLLRATSRDNFSIRERNFPGNRRQNPFPSDWFMIPLNEYVPANDRRTFLCKYTNHYNYYIVKNHPNPRNMSALARWIGAAMTAIHCTQYTKNTLCITMEDQKLGEDRNREVDRTLARGSTVKLSVLKKCCALRPWEKKYWPLIWDHLCSAFRMLPPISMLVPCLEKSIDKAFRNVAQINNRHVYYNQYTLTKNKYLADLEEIQRRNEQERRRRRSMERRERSGHRNDYRQDQRHDNRYEHRYDPRYESRRYDDGNNYQNINHDKNYPYNYHRF